MIIKTTLTVNGYKATLKHKLQLYQEGKTKEGENAKKNKKNRIRY